MVLKKTDNMLVMKIEGEGMLPTIWLNCEYSKVIVLATTEMERIKLTRTTNETDGEDLTLVRRYDDNTVVPSTGLEANILYEILDPCVIGIKVVLLAPGTFYLRAKK